MATDNHTTIVGNLVDDPELRFTNNGIAVANLRVAVTQRIQQDGEWRDGDTSFLKVNVWRGQAEHLADSLAKGDRVMVTGRLRQRSWETPEGDKRSVTEIEADEVGASLKWATAKVERSSQRGNGDRAQGRERAGRTRRRLQRRPPVLSSYSFSALGSAGGAELLGGTERIRRDVILIRDLHPGPFPQDRTCHLLERRTVGDHWEPLGSDGVWTKRGPRPATAIGRSAWIELDREVEEAVEGLYRLHLELASQKA
jgi:single-strand DNA-binding protein